MIFVSLSVRVVLQNVLLKPPLMETKIVFDVHDGELVDGGLAKDWGIYLVFIAVAVLLVANNNYSDCIPVCFHIEIVLDCKA